MRKRVVTILVVASMIIGLAACGTKTQETTSEPSASVTITEETPEKDSLGGKLAGIFKAEMGKGTAVNEIIDKIIAESGFDCGTMDCQEGFLNGFSGDITGFSSATMFGPYIGSIPFIGYIFETDDTDALKESLTKLSDPRWNICTEAAETVIEVSGNYVFFVMCPGEDF